MDPGESAYIVNIISQETVLEHVTYKYIQSVGLTATDDRGFSLNINEIGIKSQASPLCEGDAPPDAGSPPESLAGVAAGMTQHKCVVLPSARYGSRH